MEWQDWVNTAFAICADFDEKIKYYHRLVHWMNGNRNNSGIFNIQWVK